MPNPKLKILHITPAYEPAFEMGGIVTCLSSLCRGLVEQGHEVTMFTTNMNTLGKPLNVELNSKVDIGGVSVWYFPIIFKKSSFAYSPELGKACALRIKEFDIVHISSMWSYPGIPATHYSIKYGIPYIITPHGSLEKYSLKKSSIKKNIFYYVFFKKSIDNCAALHFTATNEKNNICEWIPASTFKYVIPNPINLADYEILPEKDSARDELNIDRSKIVISYIGRLHKRKALDLLIKTADIMKKRQQDVKILICGPDDGYKVFLERLAAELNLKSDVIFKDYIDMPEKKRVLSASDFFWFATHPGENFGHSAAEAMMAGVPVILSKNVGIQEDAIKNNAGILVEQDSNVIADTIIEHYNDKKN